MRERAVLFSASFLLLAGTSVAGITTSIGFEPPDYGPGHISGQDGWVAAGFSFVNSVRPHSGIQSLDVGPITDLNATRAFPGTPFHYGVGTFWYMKASFFFNPGSSGKHLALGLTPSIGGGFLVGLSDTGGIYYYTGTTDTTENIGSALQGKWVDIGMRKVDEQHVQITADTDTDHFSFIRTFSSVTDRAHNLTISGTQIGGDEAHGFVDDIEVGTVVPEPGSIAAMTVGMAALIRRRRLVNLRG